MGRKLRFMEISKKEKLTDVQNRVCRGLTKMLVDESDGDIPVFECSFDDSRLYEFQWKEKWKGFGFFAAFVEVGKINEFVRENEEFAEWLGFDPLNPDGYEVETEVYVYSPNSFPTKGLSSLLLNEADIVLVTTKDIMSKYRGSFSEKKIKKKGDVKISRLGVTNNEGGTRKKPRSGGSRKIIFSSVNLEIVILRTIKGRVFRRK